MILKFIKFSIMVCLFSVNQIVLIEKLNAQTENAQDSQYSEYSEMSEVALLNYQRRLLLDLNRYLLKIDKARINDLISEIDMTLKQINELGISHVETHHQFSSYYIKFRYSTILFNRLGNNGLHNNNLPVINKIFETITAKRGLDRSPYLKISFSTFNSIRNILLEYKKTTTNEDLIKAIDVLSPLLGRAIAESSNGDSRLVFQSGILLYKNILKIYPLLLSESRTQNNYTKYFQLEGIMEFYHEYAQIDDKELND